MFFVGEIGSWLFVTILRKMDWFIRGSILRIASIIGFLLGHTYTQLVKSIIDLTFNMNQKDGKITWNFKTGSEKIKLFPDDIFYENDKIIRTPPIKYPNSKGLGDDFFKAMSKNGNKVAQVT